MFTIHKSTKPSFIALSILILSSLPVAAGCVMDLDAASDEPGDQTENAHCVSVAKASAETRYEVDGDGVERVVEVTQLDDAAAGSAKQGAEVVCFDNYSDAMFHASAGAIDLPLDATPEDGQLALANLDASKSSSPISIKSSIIGIDHDNTNYGGSSQTWTVDNSNGCNRYSCGFLGLSWCRKSYNVTSLGSWNDRFESSKAFAACNNNVHYEHNDFQGASLECTSDCSSMGIMNNKSSSRKWYN